MFNDHIAIELFDTSNHDSAVGYFNSYFSISRGRTRFELLQGVLSNFSQFPYENLSKIIKHYKLPSSTDKFRLPGEVMEDHVTRHLGGTCFSLCYFLHTILVHWDFLCYPVMADMRWGKNVHCALIVLIDNDKYLVDPGYLLNQPMEMNEKKPRVLMTPFSGVELVFRAETALYELFTFNREKLNWRYRFKDRHVSADEFLSHWKSSFGWNSMHGLCLTKVQKGKMIYIHKTYMQETSYDVKKKFNIKNHVHGTINKLFAIDAQITEEALSAVEGNMNREREKGLWVPSSRRDKQFAEDERSEI